ncbi:hypothetical protein [Burkholderia diffusa]|nr:hypothetical protein [Burkholderia diffusa]
MAQQFRLPNESIRLAWSLTGEFKAFNAGFLEMELFFCGIGGGGDFIVD